MVSLSCLMSVCQVVGLCATSSVESLALTLHYGLVKDAQGHSKYVLPHVEGGNCVHSTYFITL